MSAATATAPETTETVDATATPSKAGRKPNPETARRAERRKELKSNFSTLNKLRRTLERAKSEISDANAELAGDLSEQVANISTQLDLHMTIVDEAIAESKAEFAEVALG